jgi:hypothetical protein
VSNPRDIPARNNIGDDAPLRLAVLAAGYLDESMTASGLRREVAKRRLAIERAATLRPARVGPKRIVFAKSQQFDRRLTALWRAVDVRIDRRRLTGEARIRQGREAARCGPVGWLKSAGISAVCREAPFDAAACIFGERKKDQCSAHLVCDSPDTFDRVGTSAAARSVAPRAFRSFASSQVPWHTADMACPHQSRRLVSPPRGAAGDIAGGPGRER